VPSIFALAICLVMAAMQKVTQFIATATSMTFQADEEVATPRYCAGEVERRRTLSSHSDTAWMRIRTPSPENMYYLHGSRAPLPPPEKLLSPALMRLPCITYSPVLCFMPMCATSTDASFQSDSETMVGSSLPSVSSWSSFNCAWSSPRSSVAEMPDMETASAEFNLSYECEDCEASAELSDSSETLIVTAEDAPSTGSIGHPFSCAAACKYIKKSRGCKDGADCDRCHLCAFKNSKPKKNGAEEAQVSAAAKCGARKVR